MNKNAFETVRLAKGEVNVFDFGGVKLHAYKTNDPMSDEVFVVEKNGSAVVIELPCFFDNIKELSGYLGGMNVAGVFVAYHGAGGSFLPGVPKYATENAAAYSQNGGGKALIDNFAAAFGGAFDSSVCTITDIIGEGKNRSRRNRLCHQKDAGSVRHRDSGNQRGLHAHDGTRLPFDCRRSCSRRRNHRPA